jgi:predicted double-glycine peptidase
MRLLICFFSIFAALQSFSAPRSFLPVPLVRQTTPYSCGAGALMGILYYWKVFDGGETSLHEPLKVTPENGTHPEEIVKVAKSFGLNAEWRHNSSLAEIRRALLRREPVIVDFQAWGDPPPKSYKDVWNDGHYAVVIGMDAAHIYFMDPSAPLSYAYLTHADFLDRWHDIEIKNGKEEKLYNEAIFFSGKAKLSSFPSGLTKIE